MLYTSNAINHKALIWPALTVSQKKAAFQRRTSQMTGRQNVSYLRHCRIQSIIWIAAYLENINQLIINMSVKISYNLCLEIRHCSNNIPPFNAAANTSSEYKFKLLVLKFANKLSFFLIRFLVSRFKDTFSISLRAFIPKGCVEIEGTDRHSKDSSKLHIVVLKVLPRLCYDRSSSIPNPNEPRRTV